MCEECWSVISKILFLYLEVGLLILHSTQKYALPRHSVLNLPMYKTCGTQRQQSDPQSIRTLTGLRRTEQALLSLFWLFSLLNVALPPATALPLGFWIPLGNSALQHRFHGCVTAVTCARACGAGDERQRSGDVPGPSRSAGHGAAQPRGRGAVPARGRRGREAAAGPRASGSAPAWKTPCRLRDVAELWCAGWT